MDPVSRRFMWKVIAKMSTHDARCSVILTTHSKSFFFLLRIYPLAYLTCWSGMEEAEALCTRIGVMVNGRLCCIGSGQHLKHRFGNGYEVNIKTEAVSYSQCRELLLQVAIDLNDGRTAADAKLLLRRNVSLSLLLTDLTSLSMDEWERMGLVLLSRGEVVALCDVIESARRTPSSSSSPRKTLIGPMQSGSILEDVLAADGCVSLKMFFEWWVAEDMSDAIASFMKEEFPNRSKFLERSTLLNFRYRIFKSDPAEAEASAEMEASAKVHAITSSLSEIFAKFERRKATLSVQEYSVGQTTLEQIFNQFAARQDNPEVH